MMVRKWIGIYDLMVIGTLLIVSGLVLTSWSAPEAPEELSPPEAPDLGDITDELERTRLYNDYKTEYDKWLDDWEQYEEDMDKWNLMQELATWVLWIGVLAMFWGTAYFVRKHSTSTPLEEYNEVQCKHCGEWIKRSWRTCPFCEKDL
jgi:hypothetical protein